MSVFVLIKHKVLFAIAPAEQFALLNSRNNLRIVLEVFV